MLKYSIKLGQHNTELNEIIYETLYFSNDLSFISGITSLDNNIIHGNDAYLQYDNSSEFYKYKIDVKDVIRRGYVEYSYIKSKEYICTIDSMFCYKSNYGIELSQYKSNKIWCDDGIISINGIDYVVDFNVEYPSIKLEDGTELFLYDYGINSIKKVKYFIIRKRLDYNLHIDFLKCVKSYPYIILKDEFYNNKKYDYIEYENEHYLINNNDKKECSINKDLGLITVDGVQYHIRYDWRNVEYSDCLNLYLSNNSEIKLNQGDIINVKPINSNKEIYDVIYDENNKGYISFNGIKYYLSNDTLDYVLINTDINHKYTPKEKDNLIRTKINYSNGNAYINLNNNIIAIKVIEINENGIQKYQASVINDVLSSETIIYDVKKYKYVTINGEKYIVNENYSYSTNETYENVEIFSNIPLKLIITDLINSNCARCKILNNNDDNLAPLCYLLYLNQNDYNFELYNPLFNESNISYNNDLDDFIYSFTNIHVYTPNNYYNLSINFGNKVSNNLHQEYLINNHFFNKETSSSINRIVDMEKDIYYPYYINNNVKNLIDSIIFDLHFRTRDSEWNINVENGNGYMSNWNIFDYYKLHLNNNSVYDSIKDFRPRYQIDEFNKYYQQSDLLGFLNFSDNDVFYQKSKIGKSFLRLLFYDSKDPKTQSLLHMATIFMDENELYKKYIDNRKKNDNFISVEYITNTSKRIYDNMLSVYDELLDKSPNASSNEKNPQIIMDSDKRLSSRFVVKNRYESNESSEGYYLYIFKEYSNGLHDKPIYLKVEFNHAGEGRTINFMMPIDSNGELLDFTNIDEVSKFKKGCDLNKLYDSMFIELRTRFDESENKYIYYLPEKYLKNSDKETTMRFNLYEIKIKNEIMYK